MGADLADWVEEREKDVEVCAEIIHLVDIPLHVRNHIHLKDISFEFLDFRTLCTISTGWHKTQSVNCTISAGKALQILSENIDRQAITRILQVITKARCVFVRGLCQSVAGRGLVSGSRRNEVPKGGWSEAELWQSPPTTTCHSII